MSGVYIIHNEHNLPIYVGKGAKNRAYSHLKQSHNKRLNRKLAKMKKEGHIPFIKLIPVENDALAFEMEMLLIALIGRLDKKTGSLYNLTDGGDGVIGCIQTKEIIEKRAAGKRGKKQTPEHNAAIAAGKRGKKFPKLSEALKGKPQSDRQKEAHKIGVQKISKSCTIDNGITIYPSHNAMAKILGKGKFGTRNPNFKYVELEKS